VGCTIEKLETGGVKKFYYKATVMNLTLEALRSSIPQLPLELCLKRLMMAKKFSCQ
jgi:hypothetical protein